MSLKQIMLANQGFTVFVSAAEGQSLPPQGARALCRGSCSCHGPALDQDGQCPCWPCRHSLSSRGLRPSPCTGTLEGRGGKGSWETLAGHTQLAEWLRPQGVSGRWALSSLSSPLKRFIPVLLPGLKSGFQETKENHLSSLLQMFGCICGVLGNLQGAVSPVSFWARSQPCSVFSSSSNPRKARRVEPMPSHPVKYLRANAQVLPVSGEFSGVLVPGMGHSQLNNEPVCRC